MFSGSLITVVDTPANNMTIALFVAICLSWIGYTLLAYVVNAVMDEADRAARARRRPTSRPTRA